MARGHAWAICSPCAVVLVLSAAAGAADGDDDGWVALGQVDGVATFRRPVDGSDFPALQARVRFAVPARAVYRVISDYDHFREFIPAVADSRVERHDGAVWRVYQRLNFSALAADRAYIIAVTDDVQNDGVIDVRWRLDDDATAALPKDAGVRPHRFSGSWHLVDRADGTTEARYVIHVDPGGWLPAWLLAKEGERYVLRVVEAVRGRLADTKAGK